MLGTKQIAILDALADGGLAYEVLVRRVPGPRRAVLKALDRLEVTRMVQIARSRDRLQAGDLVMLAPQPVRRAHDVQAIAAKG